MSILKQAPLLKLTEAAQLAKRLYGLEGAIQSLPSERDQNFLVAADGTRHVLKIANATERRELLEAQNLAMAHVKDLGFLPHVVNSVLGNTIETISVNGKNHFVRLVTYLDGIPLGNVKRHSSGLMFDLGFKLGKLTSALQGFDHSALHRDFHWDFANGLAIVRKNLKSVRDKNLQKMVTTLIEQFEKFS
ncbi:MAG: hypothetical protein EHM38_10035, partial [Geobacteraceae bacterium]